MIRTFGLKSEYTPIAKLSDGTYKICWDREDIKDPIYAPIDEELLLNRAPGEFILPEKIGEVDTDYCTYMCEYLPKNASLEDIKALILNWYNEQIDEKILSGFVWNGISIWLSSENQFNYKAAYDLAVQSNGSTLPVTFKFGNVYNPTYYTFFNMEDFASFYTATIQYINQVLINGWRDKDSIDWSLYKVS